MAGPRPQAHGTLRVFRGVLLALTSTALAVAAHAIAGGMLPSAGMTLLLTLGVAAGGIALADRRRGIGGVLVTLGTAQLGMHLILSVAQPGMAMSMPPMAVIPDGWLMTGTHVVAVLLSALLLARAEAVLFLVTALVARLLPSVLVGPSVPADPTRPVVRPAPAGRRIESVLLRRCHPRRGPPLSA